LPKAKKSKQKARKTRVVVEFHIDPLHEEKRKLAKLIEDMPDLKPT